MGNSFSEEASNGNKVMFYGDSLIEGYGVEVRDRFTTIFNNHLKEEKLNWQVINSGKSGDLIQNTIERLISTLKKETPHLVCLCIGGNDFFTDRWKELSSVKKELHDLINIIQSKNIPLVLIGILPPVPSDLMTEIDKIPEMSSQLAFFHMYESLAIELDLMFIKCIFEGIPLVDNTTLYNNIAQGYLSPKCIFEKEYFLDEAHPNSLGHKIIGDTLFCNLKEVLLEISTHSLGMKCFY